MTKKELLKELENLPDNARIEISDMYGTSFSFELSVHDDMGYTEDEKQAEFILGIYIDSYTLED